MQDKYSAERIVLLHPAVRNDFENFINTCEQSLGVTLRITQGLRTFEQENELYAQGRTAPGAIVTNCKGGQSFHNYGFAIDLVVVNNDGTLNWGFDMSKLLPYTTKIYGMVWGGSFHSITDKPHFEITHGYTWEQLLALHDAGTVDANGYVILAADQETLADTPIPTDIAAPVVSDTELTNDLLPGVNI